MSSESITKKIIQDAERDAEKTLQQAREEAAAVMERAERDADAQAKAVLEKAKSDGAEAERRLLLTASLDARKNTLAKKREVLNSAFFSALESLRALKSEDYAALMLRLALSSSETGRETLRAPSCQLERYEAPYVNGQTLLEYINEGLKKVGKVGELRLGAATDEVESGFLLEGERSDIDCSLEALLADFRAEREQEVAAILFESGV